MIAIRATSLARVIACNGYLTMGGDLLPIVHPSTDDAEEGTAAHWLAATVLRGEFSDPIELVDRKSPAGFYITPDMAEYVAEFIDIVRARETAGASHYVETNTDHQPVEGVFINGRADHIEYDRINNVLYVDDFKYGFGIHEPEFNWTLISHALGHCRQHGIRPIKIVFTIHQPRPYHPDGARREWPISYEVLEQLGASLATTLHNLSQMLVTGPHCKNCAAQNICPAFRLATNNAIDETVARAFSDNITDEALGVEMQVLERAEAIIKQRKDALEELARHRLTSGAHVIPGYALDNSYGRLAWNDGITPEVVKALTGRDDLSVTKLITPTQAKKKGVDENIVNVLATRPYQGTKLVRMNANKQAQRLFGTKGN